MPDNISRKACRKLLCHPQTSPGGVAAESVHTIDALVENATDDKLTLSYVLQGDLDTIMIPSDISGVQPGRQVDELWRHTCFELFIMVGDGPGYREYNFSPSGEWATYSFRDYRRAQEPQSLGSAEATAPVIPTSVIPTSEIPAPLICVSLDAERLTLEAEILLDRPPSGLPSAGRSLRLGLATVVEANDGSLSYWALRHPPGKPDFHHIDAFDLRFDWPEV